MAHPGNDQHAHHAATKMPAATTATSALANEQELLIEGASCASCVTKIETALRRVPGVADAAMNFAQRTVTVTGNVDSQALIRAVENAGYGAKSLAARSSAEELDDKEKVRVALKAGTETTRGKIHFGNNQFPIQDYYLIEVKAGGAGGMASARSIEKIEANVQDIYAKSCPMK